MHLVIVFLKVRDKMKSRKWSVIICVVIIGSVGAANAAGISGESGTAALAMRWLEEGLDGMDLISSESGGFPFEISGSKFLLNGEEVFLNIIGYQPLAPDQEIGDELNRNRVRDDLRRWRGYEGGTEPVVVRLYPGPGDNDPNWRMPRDFYDGIRELGFWIIRDIHFDQNFCDPNFVEKGHNTIDAVLAEVNEANAMDLIFAWEIGNEFPDDEKITPCGDPNVIEDFIEEMCSYLKTEIGALEANDDSNWVTWGTYPSYDPLHSDDNEWEPAPNCLDYISYNTYSYWPEHVVDHQPGPVTGTPYQGYLAALKKCYPNKPLVISETGLSDSNQAIVQGRHHTWYPAYRYGGLSPEQVAEGLAERYWDARLLRDVNDANIVIAGLSIFEWNDEWWKAGEADEDDQKPEEHFGLGHFAEDVNLGRYQLRYKLQQEVIRDLFTLNFNNDANIIDSVVADSNTLGVDANTWVHAVVSDSAAKPVRLRWETNRGYIIGDPNAVYDANRLGEPNSVMFYSGKTWLGPARITVVGVDANRNVETVSARIDIQTSEPNHIEILTLGPGLETGKASGRVYNVDLEEYKLICYLKLNWADELWAKPYFDMKSIWINKEGYWWTKVQRWPDESLFCWLVPVDHEHPNKVPFPTEPNWPPGHIAEANTLVMDANYYNDVDNDLLPDYWEPNLSQDRYDDFDNDGAHNLEEFLAGTAPNDVNDPNKNDADGDGLLDNWERRFFGDIDIYDDSDDPDGDGLTNSEELSLGLHPVRVGVDKDQDGLPDIWEMRWI